MNVLARCVVNITQSFLGNSIKNNRPQLLSLYTNPNIQAGSLLNAAKSCIGNIFQDKTMNIFCHEPGFQQTRFGTSLRKMHLKGGPYKKKKAKKRPLEGKPYAKGVVIKTVVRKPKKPNSANRKCVIVRLSTGKEMTAYVPGIGHNLQEHNVVLCRVGKLQDTPSVRIKCVRGKYDLPHVMKRT